ncbi:MAG: hypothetical protein WBG01_13280 [Bacteroidota bacterium]
MKRREFTRLLGATTGIVTVAPLEFTAGMKGIATSIGREQVGRLVRGMR